MTTLTRVSQQWQNRPDDERFTSLPALASFTGYVRQNSKELVLSNRDIRFAPDEEDATHKGLYLIGPSGGKVVPTNHAFNQACGLVGAPAAYLSDLPSPLIADCLNFGMHVHRDVKDVGLLIRRPITPAGLQEGPNVAAALTGPTYGRVWNAQVSEQMVKHLGNGYDGRWKVPGPFNGKLTEVTRENTTIFAGEKDMFVFLSDDDHRIDLPNRRGTEHGELSRGIYMWNSEVGAGTLGMAYFYYDYMCCNRLLWGVREFQETRIRHTKGAPVRWAEDLMPQIEAFAKAPTDKPILDVIASARAKSVADRLDTFLADRFGNRADAIVAAHLADEGRPMETLWDVVVGATALARLIPVQSSRVSLEREAGKVLAMAM